MSTISTSIPGFSGDSTGAAAIFAGTGDVVENTVPALVVDRLNVLLRGEISAAETFRNVLGKLASADQHDNVSMLSDLQADHGRAAQQLRQRIVDLGGEPSDSSGVWGVWAQAVQETLCFFGGDRGGLRALIEGEEHGLKDYQSALNEVDPTSAQLIQNVLIPGEEQHIAVLDQLLRLPTE
jgi:bacterioferritin (cytochrome b1)